MERQGELFGTLLSWVSLSQKDQAHWIVSYLLRTQSNSALAQYLKGEGVSAEGYYRHAVIGGQGALESVVQARILDSKSRDLIQRDWQSEKFIGRMRGAWYQKRYREKSVKQVSFQLSQDVADKVDRIARDRGQSRTHTLEQMVLDGVDAFDVGSKRFARRAEKLQLELEKEQRNARATERTFNQWSENLLKALAEETVTRFCCYDWGDKSDEDLIASFERMIEIRVAELAPEEVLLRGRGGRKKPVKDYFIECLYKSLKG